MSKKRLSLPATIVFGITVLFIVVAGVCLYLYNRPLNLNIPTPKMPQPNAYDYFLSAKSQEVFEGQCYEAMSSPPYNKLVPSGMPGMFAIPGMPSMAPPVLQKPTKGIPQLGTLQRPYTLAEKRALIKANEPVFKTLHEGFKYECLAPPVRSSSNMNLDGSKFRELARLLSFKIAVHIESGEYDQAMQTVLDGIELGSVTTNGAPIISSLVSSAIYSIVGKDSSAIVDKLDAKQAREAAVRLESIISKSASFKNILREDKYVDLSIMLDEPSGMSISTMWDSFRNSPKDFFNDFKLAVNKKEMLRRYDTDWDNAIRYASKPFTEYIKSPLPPCGEMMQPTAELLPSFRYSYDYDRWKNDRLMLRLALRAYKLEHGKYPTKLDDLAPGYIKKIPTDPFAVKGEYKYKSTGGSYLLYSIGPDCKDDGGKSVPKGLRRPDMKAKGDLVVECK